MANLLIHSQDFLHLISSRDIMYCKSDNCYTIVWLLNDKFHIVSKSLNKFSEGLNSAHFIRVHQSYLINTHFIKAIDKKKKMIVLQNDLIIPFSLKIKDLIIRINEIMS